MSENDNGWPPCGRGLVTDLVHHGIGGIVGGWRGEGTGGEVMRGGGMEGGKGGEGKGGEVMGGGGRGGGGRGGGGKGDEMGGEGMGGEGMGGGGKGGESMGGGKGGEGKGGACPYSCLPMRRVKVSSSEVGCAAIEILHPTRCDLQRTLWQNCRGLVM